MREVNLNELDFERITLHFPFVSHFMSTSELLRRRPIKDRGCLEEEVEAGKPLPGLVKKSGTQLIWVAFEASECVISGPDI